MGVTTDRLRDHHLNQWRLFDPDGVLAWIRDHCEVQVEPYGHLIIWKEETP